MVGVVGIRYSCTARYYLNMSAGPLLKIIKFSSSPSRRVLVLEYVPRYIRISSIASSQAPYSRSVRISSQQYQYLFYNTYILCKTLLHSSDVCTSRRYHRMQNLVWGFAIGTQYRNKYRITLKTPIKNSDVYSGSVEREGGGHAHLGIKSWSIRSFVVDQIELPFRL